MICIECRTVCWYPSGLPSYQRALAKHLPDIAPDEHFRLVTSEGAWPDIPARPNVHEMVIPGDPQSVLAPALLSRLMDGRGVTLLHATAGFYPSGLGARVITTVHDGYWISDPDWLRPRGIGDKLRAVACRRYVSEALLRSERIIVPSESTRQSIQEHMPSIADRLRLIPHGIEEEFHPVDNPHEVDGILERLLGARVRYVLEVGRAAAYRNLGGLIRAFARAFASERDIQLVIVQPTGETGRELMQVARRTGVDGRLKILSGIPTPDLIGLYRGALCLCHPTLHEGFAVAVAEAMRCGCPVITSGRAGVGELAEGAAQLVNPENEEDIAAAMRRVGLQPEVPERMRRRGWERTKDMTARRMAQATWEVYSEVLRERSGPRMTIPPPRP